MTKKTKMTNKIKPFCVNVQDIDGKGTVATEQQIRWLHAKCLEAGAIDCNTVEEFLDEKVSHPFKGIDYAGGETLSCRFISWFNNNLIPLSQVESHLGLTPSSEADTSSVSDSPVKWTIAMQKAGKPLEVGMIALLGYGLDLGVTGKEVKVDYIGKMYVTYTPLEDLEDESTCFPEALSPFPDEETPEQVKQREEFIKLVGDNLNLDPYIYKEGTLEGLYDKVKHLFKY